MRVRSFVIAVLLCACGGASSTPRGTTTIVQDVVVRLDPPSDRSPLDGPSARLSGAAREVRDLLGHPLAFELDAALAPEYKDTLDAALTSALERVATELARWQKQDRARFDSARKRLSRIVVHYAPGATTKEAATRFEDGAVVVTKTTPSGDILPVGEVLYVVARAGEADEAADLAKLDPAAVPVGRRAAYADWVSRHEGRALTRAIAFEATLPKTGTSADDDRAAATVRRFLGDHALTTVAWGRALPSDVADPSEALATWLERRFDALDDETRARVLDILLGRGVQNARLLETAYRLSVRTLDAWVAAGRPLPSYSANAPRMPRHYEIVLCPHPRDPQSGARSLGPRCEGGIVRLSLASDAGLARFGALLAARKDPVLVEHVFVSAGWSTYGGGEKKLLQLLRTIESDPALARAALRVMAEEHAHGATREVWLAELRRLWLARPALRGTLLYALANLDPYGNGNIDFGDFASDFGAKVSADEAAAYLDEGAGALALAYVVWPAFDASFSRAALLVPRIGPWLDAPRRGSQRTPHDALTRIRHRLCDESATQDLKTLSAWFAERVRARPGQGLDDMSKFFDPKTCDPPERKKWDRKTR